MGVKTNIYVIDLIKWGIKIDNTDPTNTTNGINNAINWAKSQGYNKVFLGSGTYSISLSGINIPSGIHLELAPDCILQLVTNSATGYSIIHFYQVNHAKFSGGKIIGDRQTHKYSLNIKWERGGVNTDGSLNTNSNFIRSEVLDRNAPEDAIISHSFRLWKPSGASVNLTENGYSFYQYKDTVTPSTFVNYRTNGVFAPSAPTGRGWFDESNKCNKMIFVIDISATPLTDADIAKLTAKVDTDAWTGEWGYGVSIEGSSYIEIENVDISECTGDAINTGFIYSYDPSLYNKDTSIGHHIFIRNCNLHHCRRQGISLSGPNDIYVENNEIHHIGYNGDTASADFQYFTAPGYGIDIESLVSQSNLPYQDERVDVVKKGFEVNYRIFILNNFVHDNNKGHLVNVDGTYVTVENNLFRGAGYVTAYDYPYMRWLNNTYQDCTLQLQADHFLNGGFLQNSVLSLINVNGAMIQNVKMKGGRVSGGATIGYFGYPKTVNVSTGTFTFAVAHGMGNGAKVVFEQWAGKIPSGLSTDKIYYTVNVSTYGFQVSETLGGTPVVITDSGTAGFNISRYNYGRLLIDGLLIEVDSLLDTSSSFAITVAGAVIKNVTTKNVGIAIQVPSNYVGRPTVIEDISVIEGGANFQGSYVSNGRFIRSKSKGYGLNNAIGIQNSQYLRTNILNSLFQNSDIDMGNVLIDNCTLIGSNLQKVNDTASYSTILRTYIENASVLLHWITDQKVTLGDCLLNNVTLDLGKGVKKFGNINIVDGTAV